MIELLKMGRVICAEGIACYGDDGQAVCDQVAAGSSIKEHTGLRREAIFVVA
jgi:hypothetical protein